MRRLGVTAALAWIALAAVGLQACSSGTFTVSKSDGGEAGAADAATDGPPDATGGDAGVCADAQPSCIDCCNQGNPTGRATFHENIWMCICSMGSCLHSFECGDASPCSTPPVNPPTSCTDCIVARWLGNECPDPCAPNDTVCQDYAACVKGCP